MTIYSKEFCRKTASSRWNIIKGKPNEEAETTRYILSSISDILHNLLVTKNKPVAIWQVVELMMFNQERYGFGADDESAYEKHGWPRIPDYETGTVKVFEKALQDLYTRTGHPVGYSEMADVLENHATFFRKAASDQANSL